MAIIFYKGERKSKMIDILFIIALKLYMRFAIGNDYFSMLANEIGQHIMTAKNVKCKIHK